MIEQTTLLRGVYRQWLDGKKGSVREMEAERAKLMSEMATLERFVKGQRKQDQKAAEYVLARCLRHALVVADCVLRSPNQVTKAETEYEMLAAKMVP